MVKVKDRLGQYIKAGEVKDGDKVVIVGEPDYEDSFENMPLVADVEYNGDQRKFIFNATNEGMLSENFGDETSKWVGKAFVLYKTKVNFKGEVRDGVRIGVLPKAEAVEDKVAKLLQKGYSKEHIKQMIADGLI